MSLFPALAGTHQFHITPFSQIVLIDGNGKESVAVQLGDKFDEKTVYNSKLKNQGKGVFKSLDGVVFTMIDLPKPITAGDGSRWKFEAKRKVVITGSGAAFDKLRKELEPGEKTRKELVFFEESYKP